MTVANLAHPIPRGTLCRLLGENVVRAYPDVVIGEAWNGDYRVQAADEVTWRGGVPRDQLQPLTDDERRAYLDGRSAELTMRIKADCWPRTLGENLAQGARGSARVARRHAVAAARSTELQSIPVLGAAS